MLTVRSTGRLKSLDRGPRICGARGVDGVAPITESVMMTGQCPRWTAAIPAKIG